MATLTIRKLDDSVKAKLRVRAAEHGRSMEEEAREILSHAIAPSPVPRKMNMAERIRRRFAPLGGVDLKIPDRLTARGPIDFSGPEYSTYDDE